MLAAVREQLRKGASQIKIAVGGGASSAYDPLETIQFTVEEIEAAVKAASDWGTYVMAHVYDDEGVIRAIETGVKSIEHGHRISDTVYKLIKKKKVWLSTQPFIPQPDDNLKKQEVTKCTVPFYDMIRADAEANGMENLNVAFGTDRLRGAEKQREFLGYLQSKPEERELPRNQQEHPEPWFNPTEILTMATYNNGRLLKLSDKRDPYPHDLGVIKEGSYADLLIMKETPLLYDATNPNETGVKLFEDPETNILLIMKGGKIYKNKL
jgi:imidazolonepropionase-like amidohydrolase